MKLLSRDRTICGGLFAAQRVRNRRLSKPNTVAIRRAGYGALGRLDRVRGVRFLRLTRRAADGPAQPEMTQSCPSRQLWQTGEMVMARHSVRCRGPPSNFRSAPYGARFYREGFPPPALQIQRIAGT